jgi:hypothetical protein
MLATRWARRGSTCTLGVTPGVVLAMVVVVALSLAPAPARADTTVFDDPVGDSTSVDISRVRVVHRDALTVRVRSAVPLAVGQVYAFWIDVGRGPRPNYHLSFEPNTEFDDTLGLVRSFGDRPSRFVPCPRLRARADFLSGRPVSIRVPRRCLGDPRRVRVAVRFEDDGTDGVDSAPARRTFGPWVER